ncbi:MAG: hypothetical protein P8P48_08595 [Saprospiraceae bacterium]|nr:hypothetical protein [Saprospiraceae bacterium]
MTKKLSLLILFCFLAFAGFSQNLTSFSEDQSGFLKDLKDFMNYNKQPKLKETHERFDAMVSDGQFSPDEIMLIRNVSAQMLEAKLIANPHFDSYLKSLMDIKNLEPGKYSISEWSTFLSAVFTSDIKLKRDNYKMILNFGSDFFGQNILYKKTSTFSWAAVGDIPIKLKVEDGSIWANLESVDLVCVRNKDSLIIANTSGQYNMLKKRFLASGGEVDWSRFDSEEDIRAYLGDFEIEMTKGLYTCSKVELEYPRYFGSKRISGSFEDKIGARKKGLKGLYPKFESKGGSLSIDNFGAGIEYSGGFKLSGLTIYGPGLDGAKAELKIYNEDGALKLISQSNQFRILTNEKITSDNVSCNIFMGSDSIYHPNIIMRYEIQNKKLELKRGPNGNQKTPFYSSIHNVNIQADNMNYYLKGDSLILGEKTMQFNSSKAKVVLESENYFSESEFVSYRGGADYNIINVIYRTAQDEGLRRISAWTVAENINPKFSAETIETVLYDLVENGFINYYPDTEEIEVKEKIFLYAVAAKGGSDFDRIKLESVTEKFDNGIMDLNTGDLTLFGIRNVEFSPKKFVGLKPFNKEITLQAGLDMDFAGRLFAGYSVLIGDDFHFNYDEFNIETDSTKFFDIFLPIIDAKEEKGKLKSAYSINSRIENVSGVLLIDAPLNKSGRDNIALFPSFQSQESSFVFYDDPSIMDGAYNRDSFYIELEPFYLNSLLSLERDVVRFKGNVVSSDIFEPFKEEISIQPDTSLGFVSVTPTEGYSIYQGAGNYRGQINLSNDGFLGEGTLTYLRASVNSEDIIFMPKQLTASAENFLLEEGAVEDVEVPRAEGKNVKIDWRPYRDSMYVRSSEDQAFDIFTSNEHELDGTLILTPDGLRANGEFYWSEARMNSKLFSFKRNSIFSDTAGVVINSIESEDAALETGNMRFEVDFDTNYGKFYSNNDDNYTKLTRNKFSTNLDQFDWDIDEQKVIFKPEENEQGRFLSIHEKQDSLNFLGEMASLSLENSLLEIEGVPFVKSADAFIYPVDSLIQVWPDAIIDTLFNAKIIADTLSKFHVINRATVKIKGKNSYNASGFYQYNVGPHEQEIEFQDILGSRGLGKGSYKQRGVVTRATGIVENDKQFFIDDKIEYQGEINLQSNQKELFFKGHAQLDANLNAKHWFSVNFEGDRSNLSIAFDKPQNFDGEVIRNGLFLSRENAQIYPRIMAPLYYRKDRLLIEATGLLNYNEDKDYFNFGDSTKVMNPGVNRGNLIVFENKTGKVRAEGMFNFCEDLKFMNVDAAGRMETNIELLKDTINDTPIPIQKITGEFMLGVDILIPEDLEKVMINDFVNYALDAQGVVYATDVRFYQKTVSELFPDNKEITQAISDIALNTFLIPEKYNKYSFLFNKLKMKWDPDYQSFITLDDKVGISSIKGKPFNKKVTCYMETKMPMQEKDDRLYLYLRSPSGSYYFFGYKGGILNVFSNNSDFAEVFLDYKGKDLQIELSKDEILEMQWGNEGTVQSFINRVRASAQEGE